MQLKPTEWLKTFFSTVALVTGGVGGLLAVFRQWHLPAGLVALIVLVILAVAVVEILTRSREERRLARRAAAEPCVAPESNPVPIRRCRAAAGAGAAAVTVEPEGPPVVRAVRRLV